MSPDKPASQPDIFTKAANGATASSYTTDGRYNIGGWSTYPTFQELAKRTPGRPSAEANKPNIRK